MISLCKRIYFKGKFRNEKYFMFIRLYIYKSVKGKFDF